MHKLTVVLALAIACSWPWRHAHAAEKVAIAVLDLRGQGVPEDLARNLTEVVTASLTKLGVFRVLSRADIQRMVQFEEQKQMLGCESDTSCLAEIGGALGVALLVSGAIGKVGSEYVLTLTLTDTSTSAIKARETRQIANEAALTTQVAGAARFIVRDLLAAEQGYLVLKASENGSDVEVDGRIIGVTPLGRQSLSGGPHTVRVMKTGFIAWAKDIEIQKEQVVVIDAAQVPSLEFISSYDERANTQRYLAYATGGIGLLGIGFGIGAWVWNGGRADTFNKDVAAASCEKGASSAPTTDCSSFDDRRSAIKRLDLMAQVAGLAGVASLAVGTYLFASGAKPGIYDQYKPEAGSTVAVGVLPVREGVVATGQLRF